jgi:hypothetical protein
MRSRTAGKPHASCPKFQLVERPEQPVADCGKEFLASLPRERDPHPLVL